MHNGKIDRTTIVNVTLVCEGALLLVASCWCFITEISLRDRLQPQLIPSLIGIGAGVLTACSGFLLLFLANKFKTLKWLGDLRAIVYKDVSPIFAQLNFMDILLVAASSGFCEEVFFRGVLQFKLGILPASIVFGMIHCPSMTMLPYAFWTFMAGLFLGWLYLWTDSLWTPILAHAVSNFIVLLFFKYRK
jgi:hypothetical protein